VKNILDAEKITI